MIYEIGTFIYITLNIYYESLKESLKDDTFISRIKEIKKNLNFSIKEVKSKDSKLIDGIDTIKQYEQKVYK